MRGDERWTDEDDAARDYEALPDWDPALAVDVFKQGLSIGQPDFERVLREFVTPESALQWGDFAQAREFFGRPLRISMLSRRAEGAPDVAYVRLVPDEGPWVADPRTVPTLAVVTLVWRDDLPAIGPACWRVHGIGMGDEMVPPSQLPRADGADERAPRGG